MDKIKIGRVKRLRDGAIFDGCHYYEDNNFNLIPSGWGIPEWAKEINARIVYLEWFSGGDENGDDYIYNMDIMAPELIKIK